MPNWTSCTLEASAEVIKKYLSTDEDGKMYFDFNLVIPRPEIYEDPELISGGYQDLAIAIYKGRCIHIDDYYARVIEQYGVQKLMDIGRKYVEAKDKYGFYNWYDWSSENWGTKWNSCDCYIQEDCSLVKFETAWCYPKPVIDKILKDNPVTRIRFEWYDEDYDGNHEILRDEEGFFNYSMEWIEENDPSYYDEEEEDNE